MNKLRVK